MTASQQPPYIVALGAALSANKGAASMLLALTDHIDYIVPGGRVRSLSTYPDGDRSANRSDRLDIVSYTPLAMLLVHFPLALLIGASRLFGRRGRIFARTRALRSMMEAGAVADLAGISFSDGRGLPTLVYNTLMTGIPLLVGTPVVKCSQAIGPLELRSTRTAARLVLPRVHTIVARGAGTHRYLVDFGLDNLREGADLGFAMETSAKDESASAELVGERDGFFVVSASSVVEALCKSEGIDYVGLMVGLVDRLAETTRLSTVLIAHSARLGEGPGRMNDLPVTRDIAAGTSSTTDLVTLDADLDPRVLRAVIGHSRFLLASRFHAMISGLATGTPTVVVGWSHKYREVMKEFGLERFVLPFSEFSTERILELALEANADRATIEAQIVKELPRMRGSSEVSFRALREALRG